MNIGVDTHAHTVASGHAYNTIREMAAAGAAAGLEALALTEHSPEMPGSTNLFYFENLKVVPREMSGIRMLFGVELNIMDENGTVDLPQRVCQKMDIVLASLHTPCYSTKHTLDDNMNAYFKAMEKPYIHIIGHPDDGRYPIDYEALVKKARETKTLLEVNNSSLSDLNPRENAWENLTTMLELCKQYEVPVTTGSDAHIDVDAGNFHRVKTLLEACDFPEELVATYSYERLLSMMK